MVTNIREAMRAERAKAMEKILQNVEQRMTQDDLKVTVGEYIKLIQLSEEMKAEPQREIVVTWVEELKDDPIEE